MRLAHGWSLEEAARRLAEFRPPGRGGSATAQMLNGWERGRVKPTLPNVELLCRLYRTDAGRLGLLTALSPAPTPEAGTGTGSPLVAVLSDLRSIRADMDDLLNPSPDLAQLERLEVTTATYLTHASMSGVPDQLARMLTDARALRRLLTPGLPRSHWRRCMLLLARLSGLIGTSLMRVGQMQDSSRWFRTARTAALRIGDLELAAALASHHAIIHSSYGGSPELGLALAREGQKLPGPTNANGTLWGAAMEAQALARLHRPREALRALRRMELTLERFGVGSARAGSLSSTEGHVRWSQATIYAEIGDRTRAWRTMEQAAKITRAEGLAPRGLLRIDAARCLILEGDISEACRSMHLGLDELPHEDRYGVGASRLRAVLGGIPDRYLDLGCVRDLRARVPGTLPD
jgi:transcriptional regulator with XRE-family HTH domain